MEYAVISLDVNAQHIEGGLISPDMAVISVQSVLSPFNDGQDAVIEAIINVINNLVSAAGDTPLKGIALGLDGLVDDTSLIHADSDLSLLRGVPIRAILQDRCQQPIYLENSVNAMALAEAYLGAGRANESILYLYADASIGGAFVYQGRIWHGAHAGAGQIGYLLAGWMSQKAINLNQRASGAGIATQYNMRSRKFRVPMLDEIIQYAEQGDQLAIRVIRDGAQVLGTVLSPVVGLIDPERVIVGGKLAEIGKVWWDEMERALRDNPLPAMQHIHLVRSTITQQATLRGMALLVLHK